MNEKFNEWRDYVGLVKLQVKGDGSEVRAIKKSTGDPQKVSMYYYKIQKDNFGRRFIKVMSNGKIMTLYVDILVATCFCVPQSNLPYVGHKDGNITNDSYDNLEWTDRDTFLYKFHRNKIQFHNGEKFAWWKNNWYISEIGHLLIDGCLYEENYIFTNVDDYDVGFRRATCAFVSYDDDVRIFIDEGVRAVWNKVILHKDGDYGNWRESNLISVETDTLEAKEYEKIFAEWKRKEDIRLFKERFPNDSIPSFIK